MKNTIGQIGEMMNCDIVVAHYKENIEWIDKLKLIDNIRYIFIYSKNSNFILSDKLVDNPKIIHQYLPNIGRESHSYLQYCIDKYDDLSDFTIFLQGNPCPHGVCSDKILGWLKEIKYNNSYKYTKNFQTNSIYLGMKNGRRDYWQGQTNPASCDITSWTSSFIGSHFDYKRAKIYFGANFGLVKDGILSRPITYYQNIIVSELQEHNPECCHYLERLWFYIFNMDKL